MKKFLLALCLLMGYATLHAATKTVDGITWTYQVSNDEASITDCPTSTSGAITIPSTLGGYSVTSIGDEAFRGCSSLTSVTIPEGVTSIGASAFYDCSSLTSVTIPSSVTSIGEGAFYDCLSLTSVTIPSSVTTIGDWAFSGCKSLTSVTIPEGVISIGSYAFYWCSSLTSVTIPSSVTSIGNYAFCWCESLISVTIPSSVTSIGSHAFLGCSMTSFIVDSANQHYSAINGLLCSKDGKTLVTCPGGLTSVTIPSSVTTIEDYAFFRCTSLTSVTIPEGVTSIGERAFYCTSLTSVTIPSSVTSIGGYAFYDCSSLTSVTISEGVTSIGDFAFSGCTSLTSVTIPSSVTSIGDDAFRDCFSLISVTISEGVTTIGDYAFLGCSSLTSFIVDSANQHYSAINGLLCSKDGKTLVTCPGGLTSVTIPDSVTSIGEDAFSWCDSLTSVTIPSSVTSIGYYAFYYCTSLTSVTIPEGVTSIGYYTFYNCSSLTSVTIPSSVTSIGNYAFNGCSSLTSVDFKGVPPSVGSNVFNNISSSATGSYLPQYASEWEAVITDGKWNGLTMELMEDDSVTVYIENTTLNDVLDSTDKIAAKGCVLDITLASISGGSINADDGATIVLTSQQLSQLDTLEISKNSVLKVKDESLNSLLTGEIPVKFSNESKLDGTIVVVTLDGEKEASLIVNATQAVITFAANPTIIGTAWWWDYEFNGNGNSIGRDNSSLRWDSARPYFNDEYTVADTEGNQMLKLPSRPWRDVHQWPNQSTFVMYCKAGNSADGVLASFGSSVNGVCNAITLMTGQNPERGDMRLCYSNGYRNATKVDLVNNFSVPDSIDSYHLYAFVVEHKNEST